MKLMADLDLNQPVADDDDDDDSEDFSYHPGLSTASIFVQSPTTGFKFAIGWRNQPRQFSFVTPPTTTILSSSHGLLLCRHTHSPSTYYVGNPFQQTPYRTLIRPPLHPRHCVGTHAVLCTAQDTGIFRLICLVPIPRPMPNSNSRQQGMLNWDYSIQAYSSRGAFWFPLSNRIHLDHGVNRVVIPNSGVSCGRFAYWLTYLASSRRTVMVVRVDVQSAIDPVKYPLLTYLKMPDCLPGRHQGITMKLGRVGNKVGLAVVNKESAKVELYLMDEKWTDDCAVMEDWTHYPGCLKVDVDPTVEVGVVEMVGPNRIKCREMPEPTRFEGGKVEVVVALRGGQRMVLWESRWSSPWGTRVVVIGDGENRRDADQAAAAAYLVDRGIPLVTTSLVPNIVAPEEQKRS